MAASVFWKYEVEVRILHFRRVRLLLIHRTIECLHRIRQSFEAHVDGHLAFNQGVAGSRPAGGTRRLLLIHSPYVTTEA